MWKDSTGSRLRACASTHRVCSRLWHLGQCFSVSAGVVEGDLAAAVVAHLEMAAQKGRPARHDVSDHPAAVAAPVVATAERVPGKSPPTPAGGPPAAPKPHLGGNLPPASPRGRAPP